MNKICTKCKINKPLSSFTLRKGMKDGRSSQCKDCRNTYGRDKYKIDPESAYARADLYRRNNLMWKRFHTVKSRLRHQSTPTLELTYIKQFYLNCPEDMHVDHIIPIYGTDNGSAYGNHLVCGLHVVENLQYISISNNSIKQCKFTDNNSNFISYI